jgi:polyisoprenoid-binding protein YceI
MKKLLSTFTIFFLTFSIAQAAENLAPAWKIDSAKSKIEFKVAQDNSSVSGSFKKFSGTINFDPAQLKNSKAVIEIDVTSVNASLDSASETLQGKDWFFAKAFPKAVFTTTKFTSADNKNFHAEGTLTLKGKTLPLNLDFTLPEFSKNKAHAIGKATLKRSAFLVGEADPKKANGVADDVIVVIDIIAEK